MIDSLYAHELKVRRASPGSPVAVDEWNLPVYQADTTTSTTRGRLEPLALREVALLSDAGAQIGDWKAHTPAIAIASSDRILHDATTCPVLDALDLATQTLEVRSVIPKHARDGAPHHLVLLLREVTP